MQRRHALLALLALPLLAGTGSVLASRGAGSREPPPELRSELPQARLHGSTRLRFLGLVVYDARLWSPERPSPLGWSEQPLALEIEYARALSGGPIAERSLTEMRRQGPIADEVAQQWLATMRRAFPDVARGDRLTGVLLPGRGLRLFHNGSLRIEVADADFARRFFGIWLAPETSEPSLRADLFGSAG